YIYLRKRRSLDYVALLKLRSFVKANQINLIHAHGTSFFLAVLLKITLPNLKLVWHDHLGARAIEDRRAGFLKIASLFFNGIITVNDALKEWSVRHLYHTKIQKINNFLPDSVPKDSKVEIKG